MGAGGHDSCFCCAYVIFVAGFLTCEMRYSWLDLEQK